MSTFDAGVEGFSPVLSVKPDPDLMKRLAEREKYQKMWAREEYRQVAPGEDVAQVFLQQARPKHGSEVIDFGSGTGRGALMIALFGGCKVHMLDFADNCLDEDVRNALKTQAHALQFTLHDLNKPVPFSAPYGYCTDVLEHIPPEYVDRVLLNVLRSAQHVFFQISCEDDVCGSSLASRCT
jgi:2-polyprenyl-3-methyl-5-hydroxy-6-metoxy-1,4-benzoquinol methylase